MALAVCISNVASAGWTRISEEVIRLDGPIDAESYADFKRVADGGFNKVILRSGGGLELIALKIAERIAEKDVEIEIDGYCFSACANFLALAGRRLVVPCDSLIGWHGSHSLKTEDEVRDVHRTHEHPEELTETYLRWLDELRVREQNFYRRIDVCHELLADSVRVPAHAFPQQEPEVSFTFDPVTGEFTVSRRSETAGVWIPTARVLEKYGIRTVGFCPKYDDPAHIEAVVSSLGLSELRFTSSGPYWRPESGDRFCAAVEHTRAISELNSPSELKPIDTMPW